MTDAPVRSTRFTDDDLRNAHTPSQATREVRRQARLNPMRRKPPQPVTLLFAAVLAILLTAFVVAAVADPAPDFSAWVEAMNVHPDCPTPAC